MTRKAPQKPKATHVRVRGETKSKLDRIARLGRRTVAETVDLLCDSWLNASQTSSEASVTDPQPSSSSVTGS